MKKTLKILSIFAVFIPFTSSANLITGTSLATNVVYSSQTNLTFAKDLNLFGDLANQAGYASYVSNIISYNNGVIVAADGAHILSSADFNANGKTSWYGAVAFENYLNATNFAGAGTWHLTNVYPSPEGAFLGSNIETYNKVNADLNTLFYSDAAGTGGVYNNTLNTIFNGYSSDLIAWTGTELGTGIGPGNCATCAARNFATDFNYVAFTFNLGTGGFSDKLKTDLYTPVFAATGNLIALNASAVLPVISGTTDTGSQIITIVDEPSIIIILLMAVFFWLLKKFTKSYQTRQKSVF